MKSHRLPLLTLLCLTSISLTAQAEIKATVAHNTGDQATPDFKFKNVPSPVKADSAPKAKFTIIDGDRDENGGEIDVVHDGKLPTEQDQPTANFFFNAGTEGGRIGADLGSVIEIKQINTYSWHSDTRAPQVYKLYAADGTGGDFKAAPKKGTDPTAAGYKLLATVDTRPKQGDPGGQYGVSIADDKGDKAILGKYRYLLFDVTRTEDDDTFGNTFYSEINIIDAKGTAAAAVPNKRAVTTLEFAGKYTCTLDTTEAPELTEWANTKIAPIVKEWYPKLVEMLPSEGYEAPTKFSITFTPSYKGVAAASGTKIVANPPFFSAHPDDVGAIVHEMVHVVQQYGRARRANPNAERAPGWLVEGIPDYIRWYKFEPQSHGADIRPSALAKARFDGSYRVSANFLNYVTDKYQKDLTQKLNAALRDGKYTSEMWKTLTGKTVDELNDEWKEQLGKK